MQHSPCSLSVPAQHRIWLPNAKQSHKREIFKALFQLCLDLISRFNTELLFLAVWIKFVSQEAEMSACLHLILTTVLSSFSSLLLKGLQGSQTRLSLEKKMAKTVYLVDKCEKGGEKTKWHCGLYVLPSCTSVKTKPSHAWCLNGKNQEQMWTGHCCGY